MKKPHPVQLWWRSLRAYSLTVSIMPTLVYFAMLRSHCQTVVWWQALLFTATAGLIHLGANLLNDYYDYQFGVDNRQSSGSSGLLSAGLVSPRFFLGCGWLYFGLAAGLGLGLTLASGGIPLLVLGTLSLTLAFFYTNRRFSFKYQGWGEPLVFLLGGPLLLVSAGYLAKGRLDPQALWLSLPFGLMTAAILLANNIRDIEDDRRITARTLPLRLGRGPACVLYALLILLTHGLWLAAILAGLLPASGLLTLSTLPLGLWLIQAVGRNYRQLDQATALFHLLNAVIWLLALTRIS